MPRRTKIVFLLLCCIWLAVCSAELDLYFAGFETKEELLAFEYPCIYYWDIEEGLCTGTGLNGYIIESSEDGVYAVIYENNEKKKDSSLVLLDKGIVKKRILIELPENCLKVIAYSNSTVYYIYYENEGDYGVQSIDSCGKKQTYDMDCEIVYASLWEMSITVDESGNIIYIVDDGMWICSPGCKAQYICACSMYNGAVTYVNNNSIAFIDENDRLCLLDKGNDGYNKNPITILSRKRVYTPGFSISDDMKYVAYQEYNPKRILGFLPPKDDDFNRIIIVNLITGDTICSGTYVYISPSYSSLKLINRTYKIAPPAL